MNLFKRFKIQEQGLGQSQKTTDTGQRQVALEATRILELFPESGRVAKFELGYKIYPFDYNSKTKNEIRVALLGLSTAGLIEADRKRKVDPDLENVKHYKIKGDKKPALLFYADCDSGSPIFVEEIRFVYKGEAPNSGMFQAQVAGQWVDIHHSSDRERTSPYTNLGFAIMQS